MEYLIDVFLIGFITMVILGGFVFIIEKIANRYPKIKNLILNMFIGD